jgi:hypothetical protein
VFKDNKFGIINKEGVQILPCIYNTVSGKTTDFSDGLSLINSNGEVGVIDMAGKEIYPCICSYGFIHSGGYIYIKVNGKYTYIDPDCKVLFGEYDYASSINGGVGAVQVNGKWQIINAEGKPLSKMSYLDIKLDEKQIACRFIYTCRISRFCINPNAKSDDKANENLQISG